MKEEVKFAILHQNDVDLDSRTIYLYNDINPLTTLNIIKYLKYMDRTPGKIFLEINSPGGSVSDGMAIVDCIVNAKNDIVGRIPGQAASMAVDVLMACDKRIISRHGSIMIHAGSAEISGNIADLKEQAMSFNRDLEISIDIWLKRLKIKKPKLKELLKSDSFIYAKDCLKFGFVDEID